MDDLIKKLESNDPKFIEKLNKDFIKFTKNKNLKGKNNDIYMETSCRNR